MANLKNTQIDDTGFLQLPSGTTAQRPNDPQEGMRYNTELNYSEWYDEEYNLWYPIGFAPPIATGGTVTNITQGGVDYRVHTFISSGSINVTRGGVFEYLVVGSGGTGGGTVNISWFTPGGGGQVLQGKVKVDLGNYDVVVGVAPTGARQSGATSSVFGIVANGGGAGDLPGRNYQAGDSGSGNPGGRRNSTASGGGGGDSRPGEDAPTSSRAAVGGNGTPSSINGQNLFYGGGGGGRISGFYAQAGLGGPQRANSGGGQGPNGTSTIFPASDGIVIVRYRIS